MLLLRDFNKRFTIRRLNMFGEPTVLPITQLSFPKNSVLHHFNSKAVEIGPPATLYKLGEYEKVPRVRHHQKLPEKGTVGLPIENKVELKESILLYHRKWKTIGRLKQMNIVHNEPKILLVENYLPILKKYRYNERINLWHDIAHNQLNAVLDGVKKSIEELPDRQHYIPVTVPSTLPAKSKLKKMIFQRTKQVWDTLGDYEMLMMIELYSFIGEDKERDISVFSKFTPRELKHMNFVFEFKGNFVVFNLGEIDSWRRSGKQGKLFPEDMQKRFRLTIQTLLEMPPVVISTGSIKDTALDVRDNENFEDELDYQDSDEDIDKEIKRFNEEVSPTIDDEEEVVIEDVVVEENKETPETTSDFIKRELDRIKSVSPTRYEKFSNNFAEVENLESPYGGSYGNMLTITPEEAEVQREEFLKPDKRITVNSWNGSRTKVYGEKFCTKILPKEIVRACYSAQQLGFIIDSHTMEEELTVSGHKEHHKLHVTLLDGKKATLPFTLPKVDKHGYWKSNAVKYTMRKQRVDRNYTSSRLVDGYSNVTKGNLSNCGKHLVAQTTTYTQKCSIVPTPVMEVVGIVKTFEAYV